MKNTVNNKKAYFDYEILDKEVAGIMLVGTELKSLRSGECSISESYIYINEEENCAMIKNMYIAEGTKTAYSHEETRERKLLLTKHQIEKWIKKIKKGGITIVPLKGYFNKHNIFKMEIGLAKGKKEYDKRQTIKTKEADRKLKDI